VLPGTGYPGRRVSRVARAGRVGGHGHAVPGIDQVERGLQHADVSLTPGDHDLPRAGHLSAAIVVGALYALAIAALGVVLGCWMADRERAFQVIGGISIPLLFLSGFAFPAESIPQPLVWFSYLLPSTNGIQAMLKFNQMGASWLEARPEIVRLALVTCGYIGLAWWMASRRAAAKPLSHARR